MKSGGPLRRRKGMPRRRLKAKAVTARDRTIEGACEARTTECTGTGVHDHHILRRSQGGGDGLDNLLWVCHPCHGYIHGNPTVSYSAGWLLRSGVTVGGSDV